MGGGIINTMLLYDRTIKSVKRFFIKNYILLMTKIQRIAEKVANKFACDQTYHDREFELGDTDSKAGMVIGEKVGAGFNGVVFRVNLKDATQSFKDAHPNLFKEGNPRSDLVVKLPRKSGLLKRRQQASLRNEILQAGMFTKQLGKEGIECSEVLYTSDYNNEPFIIKNFVKANSLSKLAKEQFGELTEEQITCLRRDIFDKALHVEKKFGLAIDIKPNNLAWVKESKKWVMYELTARPRKPYYTRYGFESYVELFEKMMKTSLKSTRPPISMAFRVAIAAGTGHLWQLNEEKHHPLLAPILNPTTGVVSKIVDEKLHHRIGDPRALSPELESEIKTLYANTEYWHGTGRYQYATGRSQCSGEKKEFIDVLDKICESGQLTPRKEPLEFKDEIERCISLAPARMYARAYADTHAFKLNKQPRFGSSYFWSQVYLGDIGLEMCKEFKKLDKKSQHESFTKFRGLEGIYGWKSKVSKAGFADPLPAPERFKNWSEPRRVLSLVRPYLSLVDVFRTGSDIKANYPILFAVKKNSIVKKSEASKCVALHEVRSLEPLKLVDSITHIEVPRAKVNETKKLLLSKRVGYIPVLAIEDCEAYLSKYSARKVYSQKLDTQNNHYKPYNVTGPNIQELNALTSVTLDPSRELSNELPHSFSWSPKFKYTAGLIPVRRNESGNMEILLTKRSKLVMNSGVWATPGGSCNKHKDMHPLVTAIRETGEELGSYPKGKVIQEPIVETDQELKSIHYGYIWFVDDSFSPKLNWESTEAKWVPISEIEPESPKLMGQCGALLRHLIDLEQIETYDQTKVTVTQLHPIQRQELWERLSKKAQKTILRELFISKEEKFSYIFESLAPRISGQGRSKRKELHKLILDEIYFNKHRDVAKETVDEIARENSLNISHRQERINNGFFVTRLQQRNNPAMSM